MNDIHDGSARQRVEHLFAGDSAARTLGVRIGEVRDDGVRLDWSPAVDFANGHGILHGGMIFTLADTAFAYAWAAHGWLAVTRTAEIAFISPARAGTTLHADASIRSLHGRSGICDARVVDEQGSVCAEFRGHAKLLSHI